MQSNDAAFSAEVMGLKQKRQSLTTVTRNESTYIAQVPY
ncbi:hypothetical protein BMS3Bbin11_00372 [bacterium BMS3Bbin11]|nr:hypothetical protein BMS3Bbin11_00372 [bacterium BMS3Bbin11]